MAKRSAMQKLKLSMPCLYGSHWSVMWSRQSSSCTQLRCKKWDKKVGSNSASDLSVKGSKDTSSKLQREQLWRDARPQETKALLCQKVGSTTKDNLVLLLCENHESLLSAWPMENLCLISISIQGNWIYFLHHPGYVQVRDFWIKEGEWIWMLTGNKYKRENKKCCDAWKQKVQML